MDKTPTPLENDKNSRRKFIQKAATGVVLSSFSARTVWASGGGLTGSIAASGAGSQYGQSSRLALLSKGYFKTHAQSMVSNGIFRQPYINYFGQQPPGYSGSQLPTIFEVLVGNNVRLGKNTLNHIEVRKGYRRNKVSFSSDCFQMVTMLLNAYYAYMDESLCISYPAIGFDNSSQFSSIMDYGHNLSNMYYPGIGRDLDNLIRDNHVDWCSYS